MHCPSLKDLPPPPGKRGWPWTKESPPFPPTMPNGEPWPKISIVTPSFNQGQFIEETIRSVLLQNYPNLEYIIIDGGSTDETIKIIKKYEPWLKYWVSEPDRGQSHAINKGLLLSKGDIICWINSDDCFKPSALSFVGNNLKIDQPFWLIGATELTNADRIKKYVRYSENNISEKTFLLWNLNWIPQQSTFWNRKIMEVCGLLDESLHYAMDVDYFYRLFLINKPSVCKEILSFYRIQNDAKTVSKIDKSIYETAQWITSNIIMKNEDNQKIQVIEYVLESIILQNKLGRLKYHRVLGKIISLWQRLINKKLLIT